MVYCVKCKRHTATNNLHHFVAKKWTSYVERYLCSLWENKDTVRVFLFNKAVSNLPFKLNLPGHNFTGPGTKLDRRLNPDGTPRDWSKPINRVDEAAYLHDLCYAKNQHTRTRNKICDREMQRELAQITNPSLRERMERGLVGSMIKAKANLSLGLKKTRKKVSVRPVSRRISQTSH